MNDMQAIIRANRHEGIGGSDAKRIMDGDWLRLYNEKVGLTEPEDLSGVFRVQLGVYTEKFHLDWLEAKHGVEIERPAHRFHCHSNAILFAHLDGMRADNGYPVEVKHTNSHATLRDKAMYYMPQLQHTLTVTGAPFIMFSIIAGNDEPEWCEVAANPEYQSKLVELETSFWWHVENRVPPEIVPTASIKETAKVALTTVIDGLREYDMSGSNEWASHAADYLENLAAAKRFEEAKTTLKSLVPADACACTGHGITVKRDKRGSLRFA